MKEEIKSLTDNKLNFKSAFEKSISDRNKLGELHGKQKRNFEE